MIALDGSVQKATDGGFVVAFDRPIDDLAQMQRCEAMGAQIACRRDLAILRAEEGDLLVQNGPRENILAHLVCPGSHIPTVAQEDHQTLSPTSNAFSLAWEISRFSLFRQFGKLVHLSFTGAKGGVRSRIACLPAFTVGRMVERRRSRGMERL